MTLAWFINFLSFVIATCGPSIFLEMAIDDLEEIQRTLTEQLMYYRGI